MSWGGAREGEPCLFENLLLLLLLGRFGSKLNERKSVNPFVRPSVRPSVRQWVSCCCRNALTTEFPRSVSQPVRPSARQTSLLIRLSSLPPKDPGQPASVGVHFPFRECVGVCSMILMVAPKGPKAFIDVWTFVSYLFTGLSKKNGWVVWTHHWAKASSCNLTDVFLVITVFLIGANIVSTECNKCNAINATHLCNYAIMQ